VSQGPLRGAKKQNIENNPTNAGRANLCLAVVDTIIVEDANDLAG
jgi:hypothetical protein